jgi:hypothetical protein
MTRRIFYGVSLWVFLAAAACTIAAIALPNWITYTSGGDGHAAVRVSYGLHKRCSSLTGECEPFPTEEDCRGFEDRYFCSMWRSTGFLMNFSVVLQLACVVAYVTILAGGTTTRQAGWKLLSGLLAAVAAGQIIAMALVVSRPSFALFFGCMSLGAFGASSQEKEQDGLYWTSRKKDPRRTVCHRRVSRGYKWTETLTRRVLSVPGISLQQRQSFLRRLGPG